MLLLNILIAALTTGCALVGTLAALSFRESDREIRALAENESPAPPRR